MTSESRYSVTIEVSKAEGMTVAYVLDAWPGLRYTLTDPDGERVDLTRAEAMFWFARYLDVIDSRHVLREGLNSAIDPALVRDMGEPFGRSKT